jgi:hypothetical protein
LRQFVSAQLHTTLHCPGRELFKSNKVHCHRALQIAHRNLWKLARSSAHGMGFSMAGALSVVLIAVKATSNADLVFWIAQHDARCAFSSVECVHGQSLNH